MWRLLLMILIALVWDLHASPTWAWCVILSVGGAQRLIVGLIAIPVLFPMLLIANAVGKLSGPGHHESDELAASREAGRPLILDGKRALIEIFEHRRGNPSAAYLVFELTRLLYLPLIVAIGGGLIT